jgi:hypothetical protein
MDQTFLTLRLPSSRRRAIWNLCAPEDDVLILRPNACNTSMPNGGEVLDALYRPRQTVDVRR